MTTDVQATIDFANLLCSRLCHDLLSPVGALNNGLELLADETDPRMREQCLDLLGESARTSANKLKFFRLAFGAAGGYGDAVPVNELRDAVEGMFAANSRLTINWLVGEQTLDKRAGKILLNLALIAGDALIRGGTLDVGGETRDGLVEIAVRAEGGRVLLDPELRATLEGNTAEGPSARSAAAWMVRNLAVGAGGSLMLSPADTPGLVMAASLPAQ